jgi:hypothetical protein
MPKRKNLDLAAELGEDIDVTEEQANTASEIVPVTQPPVVPVPSQPINLTFEQLQTLLASAGGAVQQNNVALADALAAGIKQAQPQRPSNETHPDVSAYNPAGERDFPRPGLKCEFFYGTRQPKTLAVQRSYAIKADDLTAYEQIALNSLEPQIGVIKMLDSTEAKVELVATRHDITDEIIRMVLVLPANVMERKSDRRNFLPPIANMTEQLTGINYEKLSLDDLKWFMAEHRAKRYVRERPKVAA